MPGEGLFYDALHAGAVFAGGLYESEDSDDSLMKASSPAPTNIDEYIDSFPPKVQVILERIRRTVREAAPAAEEIISYRMPAFRWNGILVYFAAFKKHIGLFPPVSGDKAIEKAIKQTKNRPIQP